jgi:hypothetical protein
MRHESKAFFGIKRQAFLTFFTQRRAIKNRLRPIGGMALNL